MSRARTALLLALATALALLAAPASGQVLTQDPPAENPCLGPDAGSLRCPDLVMRRPYGLYTDRITKEGSTVLRAGNSIDSIGRGPAELHGRRVSSRFMRASQRIYRVGGGRISVATGARLQFKFAHQQRFWWKFYDAARFELWRLDGQGRRERRVRVGPKVAYCLRDLSRTRPKLRRSPRRRVYPACSTDPGRQRVTLGTSIGWSDVYPPAYPEQWIDVTGLRGCFAYVHRADPGNGIYESNEANNLAQVIVRLPFREGKRRRGCPGRDRGRPFDPAQAYTPARAAAPTQSRRERPPLRRCGERVTGSVIRPDAERDTVIGPVAFYRLPRNFRDDTERPDGAPVYFPVKALALVRRGKEVTLVVPRRQRRWMRLFYVGRSMFAGGHGDVAVTLRACPPGERQPSPGPTQFNGAIGIRYDSRVRARRCASLIVRVKGRAKPLRRRLFRPPPGACG